MAMQKPVVAVVDNQNNMVYDFKRIFNIPDSRLTIELGQHGYPDLETDELCTYAPYFHADHINLFGGCYSTERKRKCCVGLAMHHDSGLDEGREFRSMPYNKFATADEYNQIFQKLTASGYDVITMNQSGMTVENKIYILNELCDFVIGYEGGLGHLAHVLKMPYIVLPWKYNDMGHAGEQPGLWYESHRFHPDPKTWFLKDAEEFLSWNSSQLHNMIDHLYNDGGNNILFDSGTVFDPQTYKITNGQHMDLTPRIMWCETRGKYTTAFIKQHLPIENIVKYPLKSTTYST